MTWDDIKRKLTSRKFWAAVADFVGMLLVARGCQESEVTQIVAIIMAGGGVIAYIVGEGLADAARAKAPVVTLHPDLFEQEEKPPEDQDAANG